MAKPRIYKTKPSLRFFAPVDAARSARQAREMFKSYPDDYKPFTIIHKERGIPRGGLAFTFYIRKGHHGY